MRSLDWARTISIDHHVGDGLRIDGWIDVGVYRDRETSTETRDGACLQLQMPRESLFNRGRGLLDFSVAESGRIFDGGGLNCRGGLASQHVRKRGRTAGIQVVSRTHEEVQIALKRPGVRANCLHCRIRSASEVHAVAQPQNRPKARA